MRECLTSDRLALFLPSLRGGGAERVMVNLARGFAERGLDVDLVLAKAEGPYLSEVPAGVRVVDLGASRVLLALPGLVRYLRQEKPAAMLSTLNHANIIALWAKRLAGVPTRVVVREANTVSLCSANASSLRGRLMPFLMRRFYPWADAVVAVSKGVTEDLIRTVGLPAEKVRVIYNPVVTEELFKKAEEPVDHPWFAPGEPPVILGVGRLTEQKDFATLIRAFALVRKERRARLVILGEGEKRPELEALVQELGQMQHVDMPGFVGNPFKYMRRAAVFVLSSRWEGLPNVLIQALALGTPVVSTDCPSGPYEILAGGRYGKLVPVGEHEELAEAIRKNLTLERENIPTKKATQPFTANEVCSRYLEVLGVSR
ncbi:Glycosyltransferase involved in cell wall bisynthesis [Desulfofundulus australicus DSM 11792]|uniref:Glycosyltransferase involved in cell wall bisynthesis n=1 Tax=Desulfofundulus australicus DSM 11792 TaxID=1121425 RepID=A0A1M4VGF0_9FIRM|nr:glycosyltransferase [Desulfofundulus australicus]SHE67950.1 Glycosyltransferase involved in cell wall bisynthesis [Desulfofundulus australicus DSM 11792]